MSSSETGERQAPSTAAHWWGDTGTRVAQAVAVAFVVGAAGWALQMDRTLTRIEINLERLAGDQPRLIADVKDLDKRLTRVESTRFTPQDAADQHAPLKRDLEKLRERVRQIENGARR